MKNKKLPFILYMFFILVYANQGISSLPGQCIYYLTRETWGLSATMLGILGFITGLAWYVKPIFGFLADKLGSKGKLKQYLLANTIFIIGASLFVIFFGLNFITLIIILSLINFAIAGNDVTNDKEMCILEKRYNLKGKIQAVQWTALAVAGLFVSIVGAIIADKIPQPYDYKVAYGIMMLVPIALFIYLQKYYKPKRTKTCKIKFKWSSLKNKQFLLGIAFIMFFRFSPSFGKALMIKMREEMMIGKMFIGYLGATSMVLGILGYILYYWKAHKFPLRKMLYFTLIFSTLTNLCYLYLPNKWTIVGYNIAFGAVDGICFLAVMAFLARIVPIGCEGLFYALATSVNNFSARLGGVAGGFIYDTLGYNWNVILASVTTFACIAFVPFLIIKEKSNGKQKVKKA